MSEFECEDEDKSLSASHNVIVNELQKRLEDFKDIAYVYNYYGSKQLECLVPVAKLCSAVGDEVIKYYDKENFVFGEKESERVDVLKSTEKTKNPEKHPERYNHGKYECWDVMQSLLENKKFSAFESWLYGTIFKYVWRVGNKDTTKKELVKIRNYIDKWLEVLDEKTK